MTVEAKSLLDEPVFLLAPPIVRCHWCAPAWKHEIRRPCKYCQGTARAAVPLSELLSTEGSRNKARR
jgi:hypothetical protein